MSGLIAKLDHSVIHVSDWAVSNPFYRDVLGAEIVDRAHGTWAYRFGAEQLNVHGPGELGPVDRNGARGRGTSVYFRDPDGSLMEFISYQT